MNHLQSVMWLWGLIFYASLTSQSLNTLLLDSCLTSGEQGSLGLFLSVSHCCCSLLMATNPRLFNTSLSDISSPYKSGLHSIKNKYKESALKYMSNVRNTLLRQTQYTNKHQWKRISLICTHNKDLYVYFCYSGVVPFSHHKRQLHKFPDFLTIMI